MRRIAPAAIAVAAALAASAPGAASAQTRPPRCPTVPAAQPRADQGAPSATFTRALGVLRRPAVRGDQPGTLAAARMLESVFVRFVRVRPGPEGRYVVLIPGRMARICHPGRTDPVLCVFTFDARRGGAGTCATEPAVRGIERRPVLLVAGSPGGKRAFVTAVMPDGVDSATAIFRGGSRVSGMVVDNVFIARAPIDGLRTPRAFVERDALGKVIRVVRLSRR